MKRTKMKLFALLTIAALSAVACSGGEPMALPEKLAGLRLTEHVSGAEAIESIKKLHGKKIRMKDGHIAHYHAGPHMVMVYVSESYFDFLAGRLLGSMTANIKKGSEVFKDLKELSAGGTKVYSVTGQGQLHYFFKNENKVFWLGADPPLAPRALEDLMSFLKAGR